MANNCRRQVIRIDILPDDVLLEIFDFYMVLPPGYGRTEIEAWRLLVHVCRRWRNLVFGSPRRLNLRLYCAAETPIRNKLDVWPALPLIVECKNMSFVSDTDNIVAALEQSNRVCQVILTNLAEKQLEEVLAAMQVPFPELTKMDLLFVPYKTYETGLPVLPDSFLGGSAPRLRTLTLNGIPFPGLPKLHLSSTHLVSLRLSNIPNSGYNSPEAMVALISVLSNLETLCLGFQFSESHPVSESRSLPPPNRSILPALTNFDFQGVTEYLEELVTRIDTPQLNTLDIMLFNQIGTPQLAQFFNRTSLRAGDKARMEFHYGSTSVELLARAKRQLYILILYAEPNRQLSSVAQVCHPLHPLSTVEDLYIADEYSVIDAIENTLWLQLLLPFTAVKNLYLSGPSIVAALQELVGGGILEVLPSLQNIFVEGLKPSGPLQEKIGQFVAAQQLSGHPIAIFAWDMWSDAAPVQEVLDVA